MIDSDNTQPGDTAATTCTVSIPLKALAAGDTPPSSGDDVDFTGTGRVVSINGENATVEIAMINGAPVTETPEGSPDPDSAMMDAATKADQASY